MASYKFIIEKEYDGYTTYNYLHYVKKVSSRNIKKLKQCENGLLLNGKRIRTIDKVKVNDTLLINMTDKAPNYNISDVDVKVCYEDENCIVYNKPFNMPTHPSRLHQNNTLANVFMKYVTKNKEAMTFRPINRLDRDTTGLVLVAKNKHFASFVNNSFKKVYYCVVNKRLEKPYGTINFNIDRCGDSIIKRQVSESGQIAITHYKVVKYFDNYTLVRVILETGRTHQIRVHFSYIGHSLVGDTLYGKENDILKRQGLHCGEISFNNMNNEKIIVKEDIFYDMNNFLNTL